MARLASKLTKAMKPTLETPTAALMMPTDPHQNPDSSDAGAVRKREESKQLNIANANKEGQIKAAESTPGFLASIADDDEVAPEIPKSKITSCLQS